MKHERSTCEKNKPCIPLDILSIHSTFWAVCICWPSACPPSIHGHHGVAKTNSRGATPPALSIVKDKGTTAIRLYFAVPSPRTIPFQAAFSSAYPDVHLIPEPSAPIAVLPRYKVTMAKSIQNGGHGLYQWLHPMGTRCLDATSSRTALPTHD